MSIKLQVALDLAQAERAINIAKEAVSGGCDWIEAGTPLIKSEGMEIIQRLKEAHPGKVIVADLKTMDVGALEAELASKRGADVVIVMGVASDSTISEAVRATEKYGSEIMVDMMATTDIIARAKEVAALGASYICLHISIDDQMLGISASTLCEIASEVSMKVAVAGGINEDSAAEIARSGADIIIVGGAITKSADVASATRAIKKAIETGEAACTTDFKRYQSDELAIAFSRVSTSNICDAQHRQGAMRGIYPRYDGKKGMVGKALTVKTVDGDWAKPVEAIDAAAPGTVIVIDAGGGQTAVWGELATRSAMNKKISGLVVDGAIRDTSEIWELGFPCFSRHTAPDAGEPTGFGGIGVKISCGSINVRTGDWIIGDSDGVVVVPAERAAEIANRSLDVLERENRIREEIERGGTLSEVLELKKWEKK